MRHLLECQRPEQLLLSDLAKHCAKERANFLRKEPSNMHYCLELFRRAIQLRSDDAWMYLYEQYAPLVLFWISQITPGGQEEYASLVNAAFAKFAQALPPARWEHFKHMAALLKYLKLCTQSVVFDERRTRRNKPYEESLDTIEQEPGAHDIAEEVIAVLSTQGLWEDIRKQLHSEDERVLVFSYLQGFKPLEIWQQHQSMFETVEDVYRVKRNVLERPRRNRHLLHQLF